MQHWIRNLLLLILTALPLAVRAEDLLMIYRLAQANDPTLQAAKETQLAAQEATPQARALFLPVLVGTASAPVYTHIRNQSSAIDTFITIPGTGSAGIPIPSTFNYTQNTYALTLTQPIFYYQQWIQLSQANDQVKQANANYAAAEQDLTFRTIQAYFNVLKAMDAVKFAQANQKALEKFLDQTQERFQVGLIAITDVQIAKARRDNAVAQVIAAENELANQKELLREITGLEINSFSLLRSKITLGPPEPTNEERWVTIALQENINLQALRFQVDAARANIKINRAQHLPVLGINSSVTHTTQTPYYPKNTTTVVGLQATLPIYSGGAIVSKTRQAMHIYGQTFKQLETLYRQVESTTRQSYRGVLTQISQAAAFKQAVVSNQSALDATDAAFSVGTRTIVDVLNSQSDLIRAQEDYANARYDYILQSVRLKKAAGSLCPEEVHYINALLEN